MVGVYDYNAVTPPHVAYPAYDPGAWFGAHNVRLGAAIWGLTSIPDFSLSVGSSAIDAGIDLSQSFTVEGTTYPALPGMTGGYYQGSAPDIGAYEYASVEAPTPPAPVPGSCSATQNTCITGAFFDTVDSSTQYLWNCAGSNGGSTASCSLAKPAGSASPASSGNKSNGGSSGGEGNGGVNSATSTSGSCGITRDTCLSGIFSDSLDPGANYLWKCLGSNGGSTASCSLAISSSGSTPASVLTTDIEMGTSTSFMLNFPIINNAMYERLKGKIILRVESKGQAYYISPKEKKMYYLGRPADAFQVMRSQGLGITNANLNKIPVNLNILSGVDSDNDGLPNAFEDAIGTAKDKADTDSDSFSDKSELAAGYSPLEKNKKLSFDNALVIKFKGRILLQVQSHGEAWYVNPVDGQRYFLSRPADAFNLMRRLGLGVTEKDYQAVGGK
jgi:hypothetical protein